MAQKITFKEVAQRKKAFGKKSVKDRQGEKMLAESESRYRALVETANEGIWAMDPDHVTTYVNPAMAAMLGYPPEEIVGKKVEEFFFPEDMSFHEERMRERHGGKDEVYERRFRKKDGFPLWTLVSAKTLKDKRGRFAGSFAMFTDITEKKRIGEALENSEKRFRVLVEGSPEAIFVQAEGRFAYLNRAATCLFGAVSAGELLGKPVMDRFHPDFRKSIRERIRLLNEEKKSVPRIEEVFLRMDGTPISVEVSASPIHYEGSDGAVIFIRDITERKMAEAALKEGEEAAKALARENAIFAEIGRIMSSTLQIEDIYEQFTQEARKLINFDRFSVNFIDRKETRMVIPYAWGIPVEGRQPGDVIPFIGSGTEELSGTRKSLLIQSQDEEEIAIRFPAYFASYKAGLLSALCAPLVVRDEVIGNLTFLSKESNAYTDRDRKVAENIVYQISGAIAKAQLSAECTQAAREVTDTLEANRAIVQSSPIGIITYEGTGRCVAANEAAGKILGGTVEQLKRMNFHEIRSWKECGIYDLALQALSTGQTKTIQVEITTTFGVHLWLNFIFTPFQSGGKLHLLTMFSDFTKQKQAENRLKASEERYRGLFDGSYDAIMTLEPPSWKFASANPATLRMFGVENEEEFLAGDPGGFSPERQPDGRDSIQGVKEMIEQALLDGFCSFEWVHRKMGGGEFLADVLLTRMEHEGKKILQATVRDITARKRAEAALREREEIFSNIVGQAMDAIALIDSATGRFVEFNTTAHEGLGYTRDEFAALTISDIQAEHTPAIIRHNIAQVKERGGLAFETKHRRRNGENREVRVSLRSLRIRGRDYLASVWTDITDRKRAEEALQEVGQFNRQVIDSAAGGIIVHGPDLRFQVWNPFMEKLTGWTADEVLGRDPIEIFPFLREAGVIQRLENVLLGETSGPLEFPYHYPKSGRFGWLSDHYAPLRNTKGEVIGVIAMVRDITNRKRAEESLHESEERMRLFIEHAPASLAMFDREMRYLGASRRWLSDYNLGDRDLTGLSHYEVFPEISEYCKTVHRRGLAGEVICAEEDRFDRADGSVQWLHWEVLPWRNRVGDVGGIVIFSEDITERKRAHEVAQKLALENGVLSEIGRIAGSTLDSHDLYKGFDEEARKIITFDRIVINRIDTGKGFVRNVYIAGDAVPDRRAGKIYPLEGSGNAEMVRTKATVLIQTENFDSFKARFPMTVSTFQSGFRSIMNVPLFSKGEIIGGLLLRSRKPNAYTDKEVRIAERIANQIAGAVANAQLFEEREVMRNELLKSEARYRSLVELSPLMILIHQQKKYVYANPAAVKALGATRPEDLIGRSIFEIIHPDCQAVVERRIGVLEQGKTVPVIEEKYVRLDKQVIDVEVGNVQTLYQEEPVMLVIARDITDQKKIEKEKAELQGQLQQAQKMEAIGTLAGGIAHDFNNILAAILGYAELASLEVQEGSKVAYDLQQSMKAGHRAKDLVRQILTFARQGKEERKLLDIRPIVKEGLKFLRASLPSTIQIRQEIAEDLGLIEADPTQIHQVLMNLCTNAGHAMGEKGGVLEVALNEVDLDGASSSGGEVDPGRYLRVRVKDTGQGISPEVMKRIFDPYFTTKEAGKGTGLGLAVVHGIVKSYGGGIRVSSELGKGSTFDIYFPRVEEAETRAKTEPVGPLPLGGRERVLFVDDEGAIAEIGKEILEHLGYEVVARTSSLEALELFKTTPGRFDLVITDLTMPNMTGEKLAQELMRIRPGIPIILCTGFSEHFTEEKAKALGIREFVMKPLVIKELAQAMRRALESPRNKKG